MIVSTQGGSKRHEKTICWLSYDNLWINSARSSSRGPVSPAHQGITEKAKHRLKILDWHQHHGQNLSVTARRFGLQRLTLRRWLKRVKRSGPVGLNDRSHRPHHVRQPTTSSETIRAVVKLRQQYPSWSKYKLQVMLTREGMNVSASTIGRILKRRGLINQKVSQKRRRSALRPKARFPKGLRIHKPGDLVQMDMKHIMLPGGRKHFQFTAIDILTKQRVLEVYHSESSRNGAAFLKAAERSFPLLSMPCRRTTVRPG